MKIGDARKLYAGQIRQFWDQKRALAKQKKELEGKAANATGKRKEAFANEAATLELSYEAVTEKYNEYHEFMEQIMNLHTAYFNAEATRQQKDTMAEHTDDMAKVMEVARRIAQGGRVPAKDEQKLMEFSMEMYMTAKNMAALQEMKKRKEYDSLWEDEKKTKDHPDPNEVANDKELPMEGPQIVDVSEVMSSAVESIGFYTREH